MTTPPPTDGPIDFAILTAIEVEREAVCAAFGLTDENRAKKDDRWYWRGRLALKQGGAYEIVVAQPVDMGQVEAALLASDVIRHWKPRAALLVGIAGSTQAEKVKLGDIVVGKSVWYYEHGKVTPERTTPQPEMIPADAALLKHFTGMMKWGGTVPTARPDRERRGSKVHLGVIASGEEVIADAAARDEIASGHRKILAIEMEGYGFSRAVWQSFERVRHLDIRGICDDASLSKGDGWHEYAAAAAARFAKHFLLDRPLEPRDGAGQVP
ncbi:phosphorylase family protein [Sorangium sp. So ce1153]|uniref:5'-methylthioadenosine/S-adenosylhomocysteine nucleosidase family protein n=1 Tax=Sorangium sp. So ce1153 TaxID=3133333 RepID=UPI003F6028AD